MGKENLISKIQMFKRLNKKTYISIATIIFLVIMAILLTGKEETSAPTVGSAGENSPSREAPAGNKTYEDSDYGFSFFYPEDFNAGAFSDEENTKTILIQNTEKSIGVQIYISAFDENIVLTQERIKKELPDLVMKSIKTIHLETQRPSDSDVQGVSFESTNGSLGETREVWFVHNMNLYQLSAPVPASDLLDGIVKSWEWNSQ